MEKNEPAVKILTELKIGTRLVLRGADGNILVTLKWYDAESKMFTTECDVYASFTTTGYCSPLESGYISISMWLADRLFNMTTRVENVEVI
jgi:hypothetical protein